MPPQWRWSTCPCLTPSSGRREHTKSPRPEAKQVHCFGVKRLEFVDMADLLQDNKEMRRQEEGTSLGKAVMAVGRRARQVEQLPTWVQCFTTYIAIVEERHPSRVQDTLANRKLIVREAQRAGDAWRQYDARFRKFTAVHQSIFMASRAMSFSSDVFPVRALPGAGSLVSGMCFGTAPSAPLPTVERTSRGQLDLICAVSFCAG